MRRLTILILLLSCFHVSFSQDAIAQLIKENKGDAEMVKRLKTFQSGEYEKSFDFGKVSPEKFLKQAKTYLGTPYKYGGMSKSGLDCSGLITKTMSDLDLELPHNAQELARFGKIILDKNELRPGDIIFFTKTYKTPKLVSHAGFVLEDGKMLHASSSKGVSITSIHNPYYWDKYYLFGTRLFSGEVPPTIAIVSGKDAVIASWYNPKVQGKFTASGEKYKGKSLTASHVSLPLGTNIRVTNTANGRSIDVRINDGHDGRDNSNLKLSKAAAKKLKIKKNQSASVTIEIIN
jgi:hypothetical protein